MSELRKAAEQALEAMARSNNRYLHGTRYMDVAITALRAALAQPATSTWTKKDVESAAYALGMWYLALPNEQEPVAYQWLGTSVIRKRIPKTAEAGTWRPLYAVLPQRKPLTDEEVYALVDATIEDGRCEFARTIERAHGIGND